MANPYYNPSGNPTTGSEGLSALIRGEFISIGAAFDLMPRISTTGLFDTIFAQTGSYTFTLPSGNGTLATTANVATETTRATAAEGVLTTAVSTEATTRAAAVTAETNRALAAEALLAPLASPALTGSPVAPTAAPGTNTTQIATTAFSAAAIAVEAARAAAAEALLAPKASPALTGTPTAPTASPGTNTTQVATTAFTSAAVLVETTRATAAEGLLAPKASPTFTGTVTIPSGGISGLSSGNITTALGYTPVQQGTGVGQGAGTVKIGYDGAGSVKLSVDLSDFGNIAFQSWVTTTANAFSATTATNLSGGSVSATTGSFSSTLGVSGILTATGSSSGSLSGWTLAPGGTSAFSGTVAWGVNVTSQVRASGFLAVSDGRVKTDSRVITAEEGERFVKEVPGRLYKKYGNWEAGFYAQDILAADFPQILVQSDDPDMPAEQNGATGPAGRRWEVAYGSPMAYLAAALESALRRIEALEAR